MFSAWADRFNDKSKTVIVRENMDFYGEKHLKQTQKKHIAIETTCKANDNRHFEALDCTEITVDDEMPLLPLPTVESLETHRERGDTSTRGRNFGKAKIY